jgi:DNA topoisomerase IA
VARHKEIESFVPKKYYPLVAHFENSKLPSIKKEAKYMADNIYDKGLAMTLVERLKFHKYLLVVDNKTEVIEVERPVIMIIFIFQ